MIAILALALLQDSPPDKLDKKLPADAVKLIAGAMKEVKAYAAGLKVNGAGQDLAYDGVVKKETASATGAAEVYARQHKYAAKDAAGKYVAPDQMKGDGANAAAAFVNPAMILAEMLAAKPGKKWEADEELDGKKYHVFTADADEKTAAAQAKTLIAKSSELKRFPGLDSKVDPKKSKSSYKVWVSGEDLRVLKIEWLLKPKVDLTGLPVPKGAQDSVDAYQATYTLQLSKWNEELEQKIPPEAEKLLK